MKKTIITITGIRPDFIRMSEIFKKLDIAYNHILIHTGQHYDTLLSDIFFKDLNIRNPDYILETGKNTSNHYEQLSYLSKEIIYLIKDHNLQPDLIIFLGDSNSVCASLSLKKEGYKIGHIEAGMRSYDKRMLEEINRTVCDHCSDLLFVYHENYRKQLEKENLKDNVYTVGNTIVEVCRPFIPTGTKRNDMILMDIHRPENFKYRNRLKNIIAYGNYCYQKYQIPVKILRFARTFKYLQEYQIDLENIVPIDLLSYRDYIETIYHCKFLISDSGTGQEEPALCQTPVIVPRDYTERWESVQANCSYMLNMNKVLDVNDADIWLSNIFTNKININTNWLGKGETSNLIIKYLDDFFTKTT